MVPPAWLTPSKPLANEGCPPTMCAIAAPEVFGSDELGYATVLISGDIPAELQAKARRAESNCPERAISITE